MNNLIKKYQISEKEQKEITALWKKHEEVVAEAIARINNDKPLTNWLPDYQKKKKKIKKNKQYGNNRTNSKPMNK